MVTFEGEIMDYFESAQGVTISRARAIDEIKRHHAFEDIEDFFEEYGFVNEYDAQDVLNWLGY